MKEDRKPCFATFVQVSLKYNLAFGSYVQKILIFGHFLPLIPYNPTNPLKGDENKLFQKIPK